MKMLASILGHNEDVIMEKFKDIFLEVRDIVIREEGEDGTLISNITTQGTNNRHSLQTRIIIAHHLWDINTDTQPHMSNTHILNNNNTRLKWRQPHHGKLQISVNCVKVKAIMIINANLQAILFIPYLASTPYVSQTIVLSTVYLVFLFHLV